jgi:hypothetical protein
MSDQPIPKSSALSDEDPAAGEPIAELKELERETSAFFVRGVRKKIHRRTTTSQLLSFSWQMPGMAFAALGNMVIHILSALTIRKGE